MPGFFYNYTLNKNGTVWSPRNVLVRAGVTTVYMVILTLISCLVPFFGYVGPTLTQQHLQIDVFCACAHRAACNQLCGIVAM